MNIGNIATATISHVANTSKTIIGASGNLVSKVSSVAYRDLCKAKFISSIALHKSWNVTQNFVSAMTTKIVSIAKVILHLSAVALNQVVALSKQVGAVAAKCLSKGAHVAISTSKIIKDSAIHSAQVTKTLFASHQKETILVGCGVAAGVAVYYAAHRVFSQKTA